MKGLLSRAARPRDDIDLLEELDRLRRQLPRVVADRAAADARVAQHEQQEAALAERGVDDYLDGRSQEEMRREQVAWETRKQGELREQRQLRLAEERLRERAAQIAETLVRRRLDRFDDDVRQLHVHHNAALVNVRRLEAQIEQKSDGRFELERELLDAKAEFIGRARDWKTEDDATVRRIVEGRLRGQAGVDEPPPHLRERIDAEVKARRSAEHDPRAREAARQFHRDQALAAGYIPWSP